MIAEAFSRCFIESPDHVVDVGIGVCFGAVLAGKNAPEAAVTILDPRSTILFFFVDVEEKKQRYVSC